MHVLDRLDVGGTEKVVLKLARGLEPDLFEHYICALRGTAGTLGEWTAGTCVLDAGVRGDTFQLIVPRLMHVRAVTLSSSRLRSPTHSTNGANELGRPATRFLFAGAA